MCKDFSWRMPTLEQIENLGLCSVKQLQQTKQPDSCNRQSNNARTTAETEYVKKHCTYFSSARGLLPAPKAQKRLRGLTFLPGLSKFVLHEGTGMLELNGSFCCSASLTIPHRMSFAARPSVSQVHLEHINRNVSVSHELQRGIDLV